MHIQLSTLFCLCIAFAIPLLVLSSSRQQLDADMVENLEQQLDRYAKSASRNQQPSRAQYYNDHYLLKKAANFEQILKPCNQMPASNRGHDYADCVRSRMLLMGRRKRREALSE